MLDLSIHLHRLVALGLTSYEAKAYLALIQRESYAATELATFTRIPRQRVYDVLNSLVRRGLARDVPGQVTRYVATPPDAALDRLIAVQRSALDRLVAQSDDLATELSNTFSTGRTETAPLDYVEVLRERSLLAERFVDMQRNARTQLLTFSKAPYALVNNRVGLAATERLVAAGGDVRCVYEANILEHPEFVDEIGTFTAAGEQARVAATVPMKLCLTDGTNALFSLTDPIAGGLTSTNILVAHEALALSLGLAFESVWERSEPFAAALGRRRSAPKKAANRRRKVNVRT
jgi:DNA-binding MarR family transcriptional regulator